VDFRTVLSEDISRFVGSCAIAGVPLQSFTSLYEEHTGRIPIVHLSEGWEIEMPLAQKSGYLRMKRVIDLAFVAITLPVWLPILAVVAMIAVVAQGRPVLLRQPRVGLNQRPFRLYKFRTMVRDAEEDGPRFTTLDDPRITPLGRFLRRFRLDELPQLWNVLRGDMSLVGPRPERPEFVEAFTQEIPFYRYRHHVRPGCAGWAQVRYGYADEDDTVEKLKYDLYYVKSASAWLDLETLVRSIGVVVSGRGVR
jgi:lipopolysaccharide/colanic/teichoic acid biosynthesis glycosyltransferase